MICLRGLPIVVGLTLVPAVAAAQSSVEEPGLGISVGLYDFDDPKEASLVGFDWRFRPLRWQLVPQIGVAGTEDETFYAYAGLRRDFRVGSNYEVTPSFAFVLWTGGDGKDLGNALEFRSGLAFARSFGRRGASIGLGFYHLSNGSLSSINPGANELLVHLQLPSRRRAGSR